MSSVAANKRSSAACSRISPTKEVAERLHISERTVKFHVSNLLAKFGVRRRADLILLCYQRRNAVGEPLPQL